MNTTPNTAAATAASAKARRARDAPRNEQIVARILAGEKRYLLAEEYALTKAFISDIGRRAGIPAYSRFKRPV